MFDIFGIRRQKEEKLEAIRKLREETGQARKELIDKFLEDERIRRCREGKKLHDEDIEAGNKKNSVCPKCGGTEVINRFVRIKGDISGSSSGWVSGGGGFLGSHFSGGSGGSIEGHLDTLKVNECSKCGHQWEISNPEHYFDTDYVEDNFDVYSHSSPIGTLYRRISKTVDDKENPEKWRYLEDKYKDAPREVLEYCIFRWSERDRIWDDSTDIFGIPLVDNEKSPEYNNDPYLFRFSDQVWEIVKTIIGKKE